MTSRSDDGFPSIRLDDRVALVTGAGRGLGRAYALELARRGAALVVNDPGVNPRGDDAGDPAAADQVVAEIVGAGGRAVADHGSVADPAAAAAMVRRAVDTFGALDVVINNAGNNRRNTFAETTLEDFRNVLDVHLTGTFLVTQAAWPILAARHYGRIVFTTSQVGFYGKVDSVAYGAAKMGVIGLMHGVRLSGEPLGIKVNCISPFALTRLGDVFPKDIADQIDPAQVAAAVALLASEACPFSGEVVIAGGGHFALARALESRGVDIDDPAEVSAEALGRRIDEICDMRDPLHYPDALAAVGTTFARVRRIAAAKAGSTDRNA